jgi:hypothetical protein
MTRLGGERGLRPVLDRQTLRLAGLVAVVFAAAVTAASRRRYQVYMANRFFRTRLGWQNLSTRETGALALAKTLVQRNARRFGLHPLEFQKHRPATQRVAADAPHGLANLAPSPAGD